VLSGQLTKFTRVANYSHIRQWLSSLEHVSQASQCIGRTQPEDPSLINSLLYDSNVTEKAEIASLGTPAHYTARKPRSQSDHPIPISKGENFTNQQPTERSRQNMASRAQAKSKTGK
jgi:hypothetical protein